MHPCELGNFYIFQAPIDKPPLARHCYVDAFVVSAGRGDADTVLKNERSSWRRQLAHKLQLQNATLAPSFRFLHLGVLICKGEERGHTNNLAENSPEPKHFPNQPSSFLCRRALRIANPHGREVKDGKKAKTG